jgi:hypothetical protein
MNATATRQGSAGEDKTATAHQPETKAQLPVPIGRPQTFTVKGQAYEILRFSEGKGPNLAQTIAMVEPMQGRRMLTLKEAREIIGDGKSNAAFRNALRPDEWGYVRNPESEACSYAACLGRAAGGWRLYAHVYWPDYASPVVILKVTSEAAAPQEVAGELRKE